MNVQTSQSLLFLLENTTQVELSNQQKNSALRMLRSLPTNTSIHVIIKKFKTITNLVIFALIIEQVFINA